MLTVSFFYFHLILMHSQKVKRNYCNNNIAYIYFLKNTIYGGSSFKFCFFTKPSILAHRIFGSCLAFVRSAISMPSELLDERFTLNSSAQDLGSRCHPVREVLCKTPCHGPIFRMRCSQRLKHRDLLSLFPRCPAEKDQV